MNTDVPNQVNAVYIVVEERTEHPGPEYSGLESSLFEMMTYGTKKYRYEIIQALGYKYQSSIGHYSLYSGSVFTLNCINYYMDEILPVYLDCFINPSFDEKQFALLKQHLLQSITSSKNSPDSILFDTIRKQVYKDSPLLTSTSVKEESFDNMLQLFSSNEAFCSSSRSASARSPINLLLSICSFVFSSCCCKIAP